MEKMNYNITQPNTPNKLFLILSILSWALLAINNLASLKWLYRYPYSIWNIYSQGLGDEDEVQSGNDGGNNVDDYFTAEVQKALEDLGLAFNSFTPLSLAANTLHKIFNFFFIIAIIGCATLIFKTFIKKDQVILDGLFGKYSKFHFIPLLFGFAMSLLGELIDDDRQNVDSIAYAGLALSLVGLGSMIFIYINTNFNHNEWWVNYVLHRGTFSCLIILFWYNFCYDIYEVRLFDKPEKTDNKWKKGINLAFSIIFGIGSIGFSYTFKDIIICLINIFIYNDLAKSNIKLIDEEKEKLKNANYLADGAIDMVILISSVVLLIYLIVEKVKGIIDQMKSQIIYLDAYQKQIANGLNAHTQSINQIVNTINSNKKNE